MVAMFLTSVGTGIGKDISDRILDQIVAAKDETSRPTSRSLAISILPFPKKVTQEFCFPRWVVLCVAAIRQFVRRAEVIALPYQENLTATLPAVRDVAKLL